MSVETDILGLQKLKEASLWFIIIDILAVVGGFFGIAALATAIVGLILLFIMVIPNLREAFQAFASTGKDVSKGFTGLNLILPAILIELLGGALAILGVFILNGTLIVIGNIVALLAVVLLFIAYLLIGIVIYNLGKFFSCDLLKMGGIMIIIPVISFIGWILTYVSVDDAINKLRGGLITPQQPQVYQVGQGVIKPDGTASITLFSSIVVSVLSASIDNTPYSTTYITPNVLNVGNNFITMKFAGVTGLVPGYNYYVTIFLSNGTSIKAVLTYSPT